MGVEHEVEDVAAQGIERLVDRGEHGEGAGALERGDEAARRHSAHQRAQLGSLLGAARVLGGVIARMRGKGCIAAAASLPSIAPGEASGKHVDSQLNDVVRLGRGCGDGRQGNHCIGGDTRIRTD